MVTLLIEGQRIELYKDEKIEVQSSQQNISQIDSVKTDYSRTFTVPASSHNNAIFEHFYQSDVNSTIDHNIRRDAVIEIDLITFRKGKIQLEKSNLKNGQPESYSLTFYGEAIAIKDKFNEDLLSDMSELSSTSFDYTQSNVLSEIQNDTVTDIKFPLIINREVTYGDGEATDISHSGTGAIHTDELFPAINMETLFDTIQTRYGLTFNGTFLDSDRFKKAYLYCKNAQDFQFYTKYQPLEWSNETNQYFGTEDNHLQYGFQSASDLFTLTSTQALTSINHYLKIRVHTNTNTTDKYYIEVYDKGNYLTVVEGIGTEDLDVVVLNDEMLTSGIDRDLTFRVRAEAPMNMTMRVNYLINGVGYDTVTGAQIPPIQLKLLYSVNPSVSLTSDMDIIPFLPKMKVLDFFKGVLNMFNLTCYNTGLNTFQIETLESWYSKGGIVDVTPYVDIESIGVDRVPLYKNIEMKYKTSKSRTNETYNSLFKKQYGDARNTFNYEGGDYQIQLPFENLMQTTFRGQGSDLQVGITLDSANSKYVPEPMILYMRTFLNADFNVNNGSSHYNLSGFVPFGQDLRVDGVDYSLNFSADNSTLLGYPIQQNLFATYYYGYLANLYDLKNRNVSLKAKLPTSLLTSLELNDRLIIRDKRYTINEMTTDVTSGEVTLNLLHDLRPTLAESNIPLVPIVKPDNSAQCLSIDILFPKNCIQADITDVIGNITSITPNTLTSEGSVVVCLPEVVVGSSELITEDSLFTIALEDGSGNDYLLEEGDGSATATYVLQVVYTYSNGDTSTSFVYINQGEDEEATSTAPNVNA